MNKKIIYVLVLFLLCVGSVSAEDSNVTVTKSSEYEKTIFSYNRVEVDFLDESNDSFVEGAKLKITDKDDNTVIEWTTYSETAVIEGLSAGTYYLSLVAPKDGYEMIEDKVRFEVEDEVVMLELSVPRESFGPKVLSSTSILMIFLLTFDTFLGIGMFIYAKKAKS